MSLIANPPMACQIGRRPPAPENRPVIEEPTDHQLKPPAWPELPTGGVTYGIMALCTTPLFFFFFF